MNTNIFNSHLDERLEGEDAADALFAALMIEPPAALNSRILELAHQAIELQEFERLELSADALFTSLMVEPSPELDKRILGMAHKAIGDEYWIKIIVKGVVTLAKKLQSANDDSFWGQEFTFYPRAAAAEESTDDTSNEVGGMLHAASPPGVDSFILGEFTLLITTDFVDPTKKSMCIMVGGERAEIYEGCIVEVQGESIKFSGTIEFGQFEAPIAADTRLEPPYTLNVRFPKNVEIVRQDTLG